MDEPNRNQSTDPTSVRFALRNDVQATRRQAAGESFYVVEDPLNGRFYRLGLAEWSFARQLDGSRTLRELLKCESVEDGFSAEKAVALCNWLSHSGLATNVDRTNELATGVGVDRPGAGRKPTAAWYQNPMFINVPLFNPDRFLTNVFPFLAWTLRRPAFVIWCVVCLSGAFRVLARFDRFSKPTAQIFSLDNWLHLFLVWVGLKSIHELYHGLMCKKYGGTVPRCGLMFIMFSPVAFVDVSSSWRFPSKWQRIAVSAGGMYAEFFVAAIAAWIWSVTDTGIVHQVSHNIVLMASVATLLFNGNFLMRFDGYYIFSDLVEIQNLYSAGHNYLRNLVRRYWLGVSYDPPQWPRQWGLVIRAYAWASLIWRTMFCVGILFVATTLFQGAGIVLAVLAAVSWFVLPTIRFVTYLIKGSAQEQPNRIRFGVISAIAILLAGLMLQTPWPGGMSAPAVVDYADYQQVRAVNPGFIKQICVRPGERVKRGQLLVELENAETQQAQRRLEIECEESAWRMSSFLAANEMASYYSERENHQGYVKQLEHVRARNATLLMYATTDGQVIGRNLESRIGQYVESGIQVMAIGDELTKVVVISIEQADIESFLDCEETSVRVLVKGRGALTEKAILQEVLPEARRKPPHHALMATLGGPLPVTSGETMEPEFASPRFVAIARIPTSTAASVRSGELATVWVGSMGDSIGDRILKNVSNWLNAKIGKM